MCRLYGMQATHPTRLDCELVEAQNGLIRQSRLDQEGHSNPHGWGIGIVTAEGAHCARQAEAAHESAEFRATAMHVAALQAVAHVRRATVGALAPENTHPFRVGETMLAHNGTVPHFDAVKPRLLVALGEEERAGILGATDSEHVFALARTLSAAEPLRPRRAILRQVIGRMRDWVHEIDAQGEPALNLLWIGGAPLTVSCFQRTLWTMQRDEPLVCKLCGSPHCEPPANEPYRCTVVASEPITDEAWREVPNGSVAWVGEENRLRIEPLSGVSEP